MIQRYDISMDYENYYEPAHEDQTGDWVRYSDLEAHVCGLQRYANVDDLGEYSEKDRNGSWVLWEDVVEALQCK